MKHATAFVLAGGRSSRMGSDKALLPWHGETLLKHALAVAERACDRTFICGARALYASFGEVIEDLEPGHGPLSGIQAALHATQSDLNLVLSVDLPLMRSELLAWLLKEARSGEQMITVPEALGCLQPLCAVYNRKIAGFVDTAIAEGDFKVTRLFRRTATRIVSDNEIRAAGFDAAWFANVNTPEDYLSLQQAGAEAGVEKSARE